MYLRAILGLLAFGATIPSLSFAAEPMPTGLHVAHGWARESIGAGQNGVAFVVIHNPTDQGDRLLALSTPAAEKAEVHTHEKSESGMMSMVHIPDLDVPPGAHIEFKPGGLHIMLIGLKEPLQPGATLQITFTFENTGDLSTDVPVLSMMDSMERSQAEYKHDPNHHQ